MSYTAAYARLSVLKSAPFLNDSAVTYNDEYKMLLFQASAIADRICNRIFGSATYTDELYTGDGSKKLYTRQWPITTLTAVKIWDGSDSYDTETSTYYEEIEDRYIYYPKLGQESGATWGSWPRQVPNNIKLTYVAGYATTNWDTAAITASFGVPEDLERAVCLIAAYNWRTQGNNAVQSESLGPVSVTYVQGVGPVPSEAMDILLGYRRVTF